MKKVENVLSLQVKIKYLIFTTFTLYFDSSSETLELFEQLSHELCGEGFQLLGRNLVIVVLINLIEKVVDEVVVKGHTDVVLREESLHELAQLLAVQEAGVISVELSEELVDLFVERFGGCDVGGELLDILSELVPLEVRLVEKHI